MLYKELSVEDPSPFINYVRMEQYVLDELLQLVIPYIEKQNTVMREAISARDRLSVTLRFLVTGNTFQDLLYSTRIAPNTLSQIIPETLKAIVTVLEDKVIYCPSTAMEWQVVAEKFYTWWQFPHCVGVLDGKHINFRPPRKEESVYRNYKGRDSIVLLGFVDAEYRFLFIDIGKNGRMHDASIFRESTLGTQLNSETLNLPLPSPLPGDDTHLPYVIVADDAFPLKVNLMKPYPGRGLTLEKKIFNYRLSRERRTVENTFGIMVNRFRIFLNVIPLSVEKVELITYAYCVLHNYLINKKVSWYIPSELKNGTDITQSNLSGISQQSGNRCSNAANAIRDQFCQFFNTVGVVPWQEKYV